MYMCVCVCRGQGLTSGVFLITHHLTYLGKPSHLNLESANLVHLANQPTLRINFLHLSSAGVSGRLSFLPCNFIASTLPTKPLLSP